MPNGVRKNENPGVQLFLATESYQMFDPDVENGLLVGDSHSQYIFKLWEAAEAGQNNLVCEN